MRRPRPSALTKLLPLLAAALLTHGSAAAYFKATGATPTRAQAEPPTQAVPDRPLNPNRPALTDAGGVRLLPLGTLVVVAGVVTTPPGAYKSSTEDEGFAVEDRNGAGVYVRTNLRTRLRVGSRVRVTGRLEESNGKLVIVPSRARDIEPRGVASAPRPRRFSTREIGEATEGRLVQVAGHITKAVQGDAPYGFRFFIDDGTGEVQVFVSTSTKISRAGLRPGRRVTVTGFSGQYKDTYEVEPRFASDIRLRR